jgi:hypothetical protein
MVPVFSIRMQHLPKILDHGAAPEASGTGINTWIQIRLLNTVRYPLQIRIQQLK